MTQRFPTFLVLGLGLAIGVPATAQQNRRDDQQQRQAQQQAPDRPQDQQRQRERRDGDQDRGTECRICGLTVVQQQDGLEVVDIARNSPAADASIREGDLILTVDGQSIDSPQQLRSAMRQSQRRNTESTVSMRLQRDDRTRQVTLQLDPATDGGRMSAQADRQRDGRQGQQRARQRDRYSEGDTQRYGALGVLLDPRHQGRGAKVSGVYRGSPAAQAGIRSGDQIVAVNDRAVRDHSALIDEIMSMNPDEEVTLTVMTDGNRETLDIVLGAREEQIGGPTRRGDTRFGMRRGAPQRGDGRAVQTAESLRDELQELRQMVRDLRQEVNELTDGRAAMRRGQGDRGGEARGAAYDRRFDERRQAQPAGFSRERDRARQGGDEATRGAEDYEEIDFDEIDRNRDGQQRNRNRQQDRNNNRNDNN